MAESHHKKGKKLRIYNLMFNPLWSFFKVYFLQEGFLVAFSSFFYTFLKYMFLLELELKEKHKENLWKR